MSLTTAQRSGLLAAAAVLLAAAALLWKPVAQDRRYHGFADQRAFAGVPNAGDVLSNVPFAIFGAFGLAVVLRRRSARAIPFVDPWERAAYAAFFAGAVLTAFGSGWYHLAPDNERLVWDRLPMTLGFMGLLAGVLAERVGARAGRLLLLPLLVFGIASVVWWHRTERQGRGDLRPYALVQYGSIAVLLLTLVLFPAKFPGARWLVAAFVGYAAAKLLEDWDHEIFGWLGFVSGHTLKHLAAAVAVGCILAMLRARRSPPDRRAPEELGGR
jgi:hypothetical protein